MIWTIIICAVIGYVLGGFPTGFLVGKRHNIDIREHGSGNIGTTNSLRVLELQAGAVTFIGDIIKTVVAIGLCMWICSRFDVDMKFVQILTALFVILGHDFPAALKFKGGKGIAATAGFLVMFDYRMMLIELIVFLLILFFTRYVSLGSLVVSVLLPIGLAVFYHANPMFVPMLVISLLICALAFVRHKENIKRLLAGTENKFGDPAK